MECDGEKQEERGETGRLGESWSRAKSLRVANGERKIVDFGVPFYRNTNFPYAEITKAMEDKLNDDENDKRKKLNLKVVKLEETGPINSRVVLLSTLSYR